MRPITEHAFEEWNSKTAELREKQHDAPLTVKEEVNEALHLEHGNEDRFKEFYVFSSERNNKPCDYGSIDFKDLSHSVEVGLLVDRFQVSHFKEAPNHLPSWN